MLKNLYHRVLGYAATPQAPYALFLVAFIESSVFPIPPDVLLIPMILVAQERAFRFAMICTLGSVLGGIAGYVIGALFYETAGVWLIETYHMQRHFGILEGWYNEFGALIVAAAGFSPIPYKVFTIFSGMMGMDLGTFTVASALSRGARFFLIAWLLWRHGPRFKAWIEQHFYPLTMAGTVFLLLFFVLLKLLMSEG